MESNPDNRAPHEGRGESGPLLFVLGLVVGLLCALVTERVTMTAADRDIELVRAVRNLAMEDFVTDVAPQQLIDDALRGMLAGLDDHSRFYGPEEIAQVSRETSGEFRGIGVVFRRPTHLGQILFAFPGSPAARGGLAVGDRLLEVDGAVVADMESGELQRSLQTPRDGGLQVVVQGLDETTRDVTLHPEPVLDPTVRHARILDQNAGIGYVSILSFSHRTPQEFDDAVRFLESQGLRSLIIDLRYNPGGILDAAVRIADRFVEKGTIVSTRTRDETEITAASAEDTLFSEYPLVVLIDEGSASASEVLAGALQDHAVAAIVGEASYGKGTVQTLRQFEGERGIVKLTTAHYYTPSGRRIERERNGGGRSGIAPDDVVELTPEEHHAIHGFLSSYSPPPSLLPAIEAWEASEEEQLFARHPVDRQLEAALSLLVPDSDAAAQRAY